MIDPQLIARIAERRGPQYDLVTNVQTRSFPPGQSVEVIRAQCFAGIDAGSLSASEREHVTLVFYQNPARYRIHNVVSRDPQLARRSLAVDSVEDLRAVEALIVSQSVPAFAASIGSA